MHPHQVLLARHVDESPAVIPDSVALHRWARQQRSRRVGEAIARALSALARWTGRALDVSATPSTKRNPRSDVI